MITENQLFLIDMHLRDILRGEASLIGWTLTILRTQAGTVTMESVYPGCETVKLEQAPAVEQALLNTCLVNAKQEPTPRRALDEETRDMVLSLCQAATEHVSVWTYPYGKQTLELAKKVRERMDVIDLSK